MPFFAAFYGEFLNAFARRLSEAAFYILQRVGSSMQKSTGERTFVRSRIYYRFPLLPLRPRIILVPPQPHGVVGNSVAALHTVFFTSVNVARNFHVDVLAHPLHYFAL